jgi:hypothetical protein
MRGVNDVEFGRFPAGTNVELGLADDYAVLFVADEQAHVPEALWSRVVKLARPSAATRSRTPSSIPRFGAD